MPGAIPVYFGSPSRPLFGWLHLPERILSGTPALVICNPLGYESISAHRSIRHIALAASARGVPALRFDYDGTGDSAGDDKDADRVNAWIESIRHAVVTLQNYSGVQSVCLLGIRLGATLGLLAAENLPAVTDIVLVSPVVEGRRYLRELRALAITSASQPDRAEQAQSADVQGAAGFVTTAATREGLSQIHLIRGGPRIAPRRVLLLERDDLPADGSLAQKLSQLGSEVAREAFAGHAEMMRDAHETVVPTRMISRVLDWLPGAAAQLLPPAPDVEQARGSCDFACPEAGGQVVREYATVLDSSGVFGIVTEPQVIGGAQSTTPRPVLVLANAGAVHHVGPNRLHVRIARHCASLGLTCIRLDISGLGDSPPRAGHEENVVYPTDYFESLAAAVRFARERLGAGQVHCAGICSGGYHSLKAAVSGTGVTSVIVINPLTFFWHPHLSLAAPAHRDVSEVMRYRQSGFRLESWRKLFTGGVDVLNLSTTLLRHFGRRAGTLLRHAARRVGVRFREDLVAELRNLRAMGCSVHFVFSSTDPGHTLLSEQVGAELLKMTQSGAVTIDFIENADHTFTPIPAQELLLRTLSRILSATGTTVPR